MSSEYFIYVLSDPRDGCVRYVGQTTHPDNRIRMHLNNADYCIKTKWVMSLIKDGYSPMMDIIDSAETKEGIDKKEREWIRHYLDKGLDLVNSQLSGTGYESLKTPAKRIKPLRKMPLLIPYEKRYALECDKAQYMTTEHWMFVYNQFTDNKSLVKFLSDNANLILDLYKSKYTGIKLPNDQHLIQLIQDLVGWVGFYIDTDLQGTPLLKVKHRVFSQFVMCNATFRYFRLVFNGVGND